LQKPVVPHEVAPLSVHWPAGSAAPAGTGLQVPLVAASEQDMQVPAQAVAQQTPWAHWPDRHSVPAWQTAPLGLRPHEPPLQVAGGAQSASLAQVDLQALRPQPNGKQEVAPGTMQVPAPSQVPPAVNVLPGMGQLAPAQAVPCGYFWQAPAWHLPLLPQEAVPWSVHRPAGSGRPVGTAVHRPMLPVIAQEKQESAQAVAQQTPCAQWPNWHSLSAEQNAPLGLRPHDPCVQTLPVEQAVPLPQAVKQRDPLQTYGAHVIASGARHLPVASQVETGV
jgi:hypothetical protein